MKEHMSISDLAWYDVVDELCEKVKKLHKKGFSKQYKSVHHEDKLLDKRRGKLRTRYMHASIESSIIVKDAVPPELPQITRDHHLLYKSLSCLKTTEEKMSKILTYGYNAFLTQAILGKFPPQEYLALKGLYLRNRRTEGSEESKFRPDLFTAGNILSKSFDNHFRNKKLEIVRHLVTTTANHQHQEKHSERVEQCCHICIR
eukprot:TRINITY_DN5428_c4_g1_i3.p1 TRINITY_DN5428_c4_g1~~TRINITY_DN5428_c4_g1_i3.p1  ORF type:complete len:202 (-),score=25.05 TRINITY_DN5428_c4_g1_i3:9-614(-)